MYSEYHYKNKDGKKHSNDLTKWSLLGKSKTSPHYDAVFPPSVSALLLEISREKCFCWFYKYSRRFRGKQKGAFYSKPPHEFNDTIPCFLLFVFLQYELPWPVGQGCLPKQVLLCTILSYCLGWNREVLLFHSIYPLVRAQSDILVWAKSLFKFFP